MNNVSITSIIENIKKYNSIPDIKLIAEAYAYALESHKEQKRLSGEAYINHPLQVAYILSTLEVDETTIAAALLHDTIEDANVSKKMLEDKFGHEVAYLVEGVTKLGMISFSSREEHQAENFRKMFLAMATDIRVIIIKLADRLHNMRTLKHVSEEKQKRISLETQEIYAPLAHRLGMGNIKWELEDLSFRYLNPEKYHEIRDLVSEKRVEREKYIQTFVDNIKTNLKSAGIDADIYGRPKHFWSIYLKLISQNLDFRDLYDLFAIRIIVSTLKDCYGVLGIIHALYKPLPGRFKDYIAMPKINMYQSLHTTLIGPKGRPIEVQIRTQEMHRVSEYGIAAHWRYKDGKAKDRDFEMKLSWLRQLIEWQKDFIDAKDYMANLKLDLFTDESFVFTPKGDVFGLPMGSTPVDFAYHIHTEVGHRCIGAKVNGKIVPLNYKLQNGDIVEIITSKSDNPHLNWLNFAVTNEAKQKIKGWFRKQNIEEKIEKGKETLISEIKKQLLNNFSDVIFRDLIKHILEKFNLPKEDDLYIGIGQGEISMKHIIDFVRNHIELKSNKPEPPIETILSKKPKEFVIKDNIKIQGLDGILVHISKCCSPIPGDEIIGFITKGHGISIHKHSCHNISTKKNIERAVPVDWGIQGKERYPVDISIEGYDRIGTLKEIVSEIANMKINVVKANVQTQKKTNTYIANLTLEVTDLQELNKALGMLKQIKDVFKAYRIER
ncbi:MAG: (p)ppGpp synthetase [Candidatus Margulisiibacteriota bacterium]|nr:MAG: (p)ppGpp synthetase [Candidatus Margulisbacteria bacterium GWD2_39_127]OGI01667.1 MAG: (p)ppGpp synthetase [Candidatus Margulisbacteria bacterium GWF2_38_17]OGI05858.1 MAG: (p)ppGpp synthetase [Candidatus Margulisbacteria bacterium GWE2_39_32]PZM81858.1 MAG: (p)ppGpp synthetase [Candidatus Margulisiibacteriota bacterium]HAR63116.1 (p)ppGpp synthetase [Candidatus Margulisiibacteriota bacterium]